MHWIVKFTIFFLNLAYISLSAGYCIFSLHSNIVPRCVENSRFWLLTSLYCAVSHFLRRMKRNLGRLGEEKFDYLIMGKVMTNFGRRDMVCQSILLQSINWCS